MYKYLKEESHYHDRYDLGTVERCLEIIDFWRNKIDWKKVKGRIRKSSRERAIKRMLAVELHFTKGERYRNRDSIIRGWIEDDRKLDEMVEKAQEPGHVRCPQCAGRMKSELKQLHGYSSEQPRVLFFFECVRCRKRRGVFADGSEYLPQPTLCPKCNREITFSFKQEGNLEIWEKKCLACGFYEKEEIDGKKREAEQEAERERSQELLKEHRAEFCFSPEEGAEYIVHTNQMRDLMEFIDQNRQKKADPDYGKVVSLKRLTVVALDKLLVKTLEKEQYIKLSFNKPIIDRHVIVPFSVQDADSSRKEKDSEYALRRILRKALEGTNWRLMSEGVHYRLGYLHGRLKGYEQEEDLLKMVKEDKKPNET